MVKTTLPCCGTEPGPLESNRGVPAVTTKPLLMRAISPAVCAVAPVGPSEARAGTARVSVASVSLLTTALVTTIPAPREKVVEAFQWVFWPWMSTVRVVPCFAVLGEIPEISASEGVTEKYAPPTTAAEPLTSGVVAMTWLPPSGASCGMLMLWVAIVGPRMTGGPLTTMLGPKLNVVVLSKVVYWPRMLTVRLVAPWMPEPGSTMVNVGWATTTLNWALSTSVLGLLVVPVVVRVRSLTEAVAVGLMVMLAIAVVGPVTWKQFTVTLELKPVNVVPVCPQAGPVPGFHCVYAPLKVIVKVWPGSAEPGERYQM